MALAIAASSSLIWAVNCVDQRALRVDGLLRDDVGRELGVALEVALGVGELRLVERLLGQRLVELRLVGGGIDQRQHVAALDVLPFPELDAEDACRRPAGAR